MSTEHHDIANDAELVDAMTRSLTHVLGRHLGMADPREADAILSHLAAQGVTLTPDTDDQASTYDHGGNLTANIAINITLDGNAPRAPEALTALLAAASHRA